MNRAKAIGKAAVTRAKITSLERTVAEGIEAAEDAGAYGIAAKLTESSGHLSSAHASLNDAAALIALFYNEGDVSVFSGGDGKPPQEP